jgi:hypothetical protein
MSVDRDFVIKISTIADTAGADSAKDSLKQLGETSQDTGKIGEKSAEGMFEKHHELHKLLHAIGNDAVPGMGRAFAALASGPLGALTAVAIAVELVKKNIEDTYKRLDDLAAASAKAFGGGDTITDFVNAEAEATAQTEEFTAAMNKAADAGDAVKNRYDAETNAVQAAVEAIKEHLKLQEEADLAAARKSDASPDVAAAAEADIRARYESRSSAVQDAAAQALQTARQRELFERQQKDADLQSAAQATFTPAKVIQTRKERTDALAAQEQALAKATSDQNTQADERLHDHIEGAKKDLENMHRDGVRDSIIKAREAELSQMESETAESRKAAAEDRIKELSKQVAKDTANEAHENEAKTKAESAATENTKRIVELQKQIAEANTAAKIKTESAAELIRNLAGYGDVKTVEKAAGVDTPAGMSGFIKQFTAAQNRLQQHHGTQADQQTVKLMNQLLAVTQQSDQAVNAALTQVLNDLVNHKQKTNQDMQRLLSVIDAKGK